MVVTPVVFFSIVSCIGQFTNLPEMGKIGGKVFLLYLTTTFLATGAGIGTFYLFRPGSAIAGMTLADASSLTSQTISVSFKDTIVGIVPANFLSPFLEANMLQLIFLAVFCGIAVGMIGQYSKILTDLFTACNELFLKITVLLVQFMPVAAFCSILAMILQTGADTLLAVLSIFAVFAIALAVMMVLYCLLMLLFARLSPIPFLKKYTSTMLQVFSVASSNAALPLNIEACQKKLGISPKVYSLALPLGATVNMDGTCIYLGVFALALARVYGVEVPAAALMSIVISIIVLSIGAPGIPGSGLICLSVLLSQLGVPLEAVGLIMGIDPLIGMMRCMSNCLGDVAVCCIVAKSEKLMDMDIYTANS
jgi:Na+/H+-dicarboxylate symporter